MLELLGTRSFQSFLFVVISDRVACRCCCCCFVPLSIVFARCSLSVRVSHAELVAFGFFFSAKDTLVCPNVQELQ